MNIIYKENFDEYIKKYLSHYKKAVIRGKGPTYKEIEEISDDTLYFSINDVVNVTKHTDIMVANDIEMFERTKRDKLSNLEHLIVPNKIHKDNKPQNTISYQDVIKKIETSFKGNLIVYNLRTGKKDDRFIDLNSACSSSNNAADFIGQYLKSVTCVTFYGVGIEGKGGFAKIFPKTNSVNHYIEARLNDIRNAATKSLKGKDIQFL